MLLVANVSIVETFKPAIVEPRDIIVKVTGTIICGSDLHLYHGTLVATARNMELIFKGRSLNYKRAIS